MLSTPLIVLELRDGREVRVEASTSVGRESRKNCLEFLQSLGVRGLPDASLLMV